MKRILLTGMSGTGKSTLIRELAARGYNAVDADDPGWSEMASPTDDGAAEPEWMWRENAIRELLATDGHDVVFLGGCASNQVQFYPQFDHVVLLSAPPDVLKERLATRTNNPFGKHPDELARILDDHRTIEPLLRRRATLELDTRAPVDKLLAAILALVANADVSG